MPRTDLVNCLFKYPNLKLPLFENILLEIKLFTQIYNELFELFQSKYKGYQKLTNCNVHQEDNMSDGKLIQRIIKDILSTKEYSLAGIAIHTHIPEEVLWEVAAGINNNPTLEMSRKIFELHISLNRNLYDEIMRRITLKYITLK